MTLYRVILEVSKRNASIGSTDDVIEAETAEQAEQAAIEQWKAVRPGVTFRPLLTIQA